jgi:hypothetical protein
MYSKLSKLLALVAGAALPFTMSAATINNGDLFNITATLTVTNALNPTITFSNTSINNQGVITTPATGAFAGLVGQTVTINQLTSSVEPVGSPFSDPNFLSFLAGDLLPSLTLTFIPAGVDGAGSCLASPALGQTCTPTFGSPATPGPFNFQNTGTPSSITSSASFGFNGVTSDGLDTWTGVFTSQFTTPYQTVLGNLSTNGMVANSVSGTITFTSVPEPGALSLMGAGLLLMALGGARIRRRA